MNNIVFTTAEEKLNDFLPPKRFIISGAGKFGLLAVERLNRHYPNSSILILDTDKERLQRISPNTIIQKKQQNIISFLLQKNLQHSNWLIPTASIHVLFEWLKMELENGNMKKVEKSHKLLRNLKSQGLSLNVIIVAAIVLIVLIVLWAIFTGRIAGFAKGLETAEKNCKDICVATGTYTSGSLAAAGTTTCVTGTKIRTIRVEGKDTACCCS